MNYPVRYVDPDGEIVETAWSVLNIGLGAARLAKHVKEGNVGGALLDGVGIVRARLGGGGSPAGG